MSVAKHSGCRLAAISTMVFLLAGTASAGDGKPFLMKVGSGSSGAVSLSPDAQYHTMASVSITPKKNGICAVSASTHIVDVVNIHLTLATVADSAGPWFQSVTGSGGPSSSAITQAFVVTKNTPVTFYLNGQNLDVAGAMTEPTRIWVICESEKEPVLP